MSKLWLISQDEKTGYDIYDSAVVVADTEEEARFIDPSDQQFYKYHDGAWYFQYADGSEREELRSDWPSPIKVSATCIGEANDTLKPGEVVCASFHAG